MEPVRTELGWSYQPANFFEGPYERTDRDALLRIDVGRAVVTVSGGEPPPDVEQRLLAWVRHTLQIRSLQTGRTFELDPQPNVVEFRGSNRNVILRAGVGSFAITGGNLDVVQTNASGKTVVDTKAERSKLQTDDLDDLSAKAQADRVLGTMLESLSTALNEPDSEFVRLYQIRDALVKRFGSERDAKEAFGISTSDWKFFGQMANDEPVVGGRHRGKSLGPLRNATTDERARMRAVAEDWIRKFAATL